MAAVSEATGIARHWDRTYAPGDTSRSWFQQQPTLSLQMLREARARPDDSVIDIGGGASRLVDALLAAEWTDITVLDISTVALQIAQRRLGADASRVHWILADLLAWAPTHRWSVWHDRAVLHFFTDPAERARYLRVLHRATRPGSVAILATFAPDGPHQCSGLPVVRYSPRTLGAILGPHWQKLSDVREEHTTPSGTIQPFTWTVLRRQR